LETTDTPEEERFMVPDSVRKHRFRMFSQHMALHSTTLVR
jgi:hypothetical protein